MGDIKSALTFDNWLNQFKMQFHIVNIRICTFKQNIIAFFWKW